jgi:predicted short-subunit dehydrogenase-like oxidoreductase (DUF2520 family)
VTDYSAIHQKADIYIIAVKDDAIAEVVKKLMPLKLTGLVVHTSGSVEVNVLKMFPKLLAYIIHYKLFIKGLILIGNYTFTN